MPVFVLGTDVPGIEASGDISLADPSHEVLTTVRLTDPLLLQRRSESLVMRCRFEAASGGSTLRLTLETAGATLVEGQLVLRALALRIRFGGGSGRVTPILNAADAVVATGSADWRGLPPGLGFPGNALPFLVSYAFTVGGSGRFAVTLAQPIDVPPVMCRIDAAELGAEAVPADQSVIVSLTGRATLDPGARTTAAPLLEPLFGARILDQLTQPTVSYRQKVRLRQPNGLPSIGLGFGWTAEPPSLTSAPPDLAVTVGPPQFRFSLPDVHSAPAGFDIRLTDCRLRFPQIAGMQSLDLTGVFDLATDPTNGLRQLRFTPTVPGGVDLPAILRLFLSRLHWAGHALDDLAAQARFSLDEAEWLELFRGLLPTAGPLDPAVFVPALRAMIDSAVAATSLSRERIFYLAFEALSRDTWRAQAFPLIWAEWLSIASRNNAEALAQLVRGISGLSPAILQDALRALVALGSLDLPGLILALFARAQNEAAAQRDTLRLVAHLVGAMAHALDPRQAAEAIVDAWRSASGPLSTFQPLQPPRFDISIRVITRLVCDVLIILVRAADAAGEFFDQLLPDVSLPAGARFFRHLVSPITDFFDAMDRGVLPPWEKVAPMLKAMAAYCDGDSSKEILLLEASRYPLAGLAVTFGALLLALERPMPWTSLIDANLDERADLNVLRLPPPFEHPSDPTKSIKYLILSDIHRDAEADDAGVFRFGSIHHYSKNRQLYLDILEEADAKGQTVIEAGDCEELWFIRDFDTFAGFPALVRDILQMHDAVYQKLRSLHARGRYYRVYGNHDSYLREADVRAPLTTFMEAGNSKPFVIYDYIVMDGVKRMADGVFDIVSSWGLDASMTMTEMASRTLQHFAERLVGFDSRGYVERRNLIITHGHQWDFFNCDEHNLVGKMLANMAGVTVDKFMDPFTDAEGFAYSGNPTFDLQMLAAKLYPMDNWLSEAPAISFAHGIQHMPDAMRVLNDGIAYAESLVALAAMFTMPLDREEPRLDADGRPLLGPDGRPLLRRKRARDASDSFTRAFAHYGHLICVGHTHAPHSMPSFDLARPIVGPIISDLINYIRSFIPFASQVRFKSNYLNSGTSGWMEGVVWGIEVHETGQPRLLFWSNRAGTPHKMDWELYPWPREKREEFDRLLLQTFPSIEAYFERLVDTFGDAVRELAGHLQPSVGLSAEMVPLLTPLDSPATPPLALSPSNTGTPIAELQSLLLKVFAFIRRFADDPAAATAAPQAFSISVSVPADIEALIGRVHTEMVSGAGPSDRLREAAGAVFAMSNLERLTRGVRQFHAFSVDTTPALDSLWTLTLLLLALPNGGQLATDVTLVNGTLTVSLTVRR